MTEYVKKDGEGACFKKVSSKGNPYFAGQFTLNNEEYRISLFLRKTKADEQYISFIIQPKQDKEAGTEQNAV